jgi:cytochrome P450 family 4
MGVSLDKMDKKEVNEYVTAIHDFGEVFAQRSVKPYIQDWMMSSFLHLGRLQIKALSVLYNFTDKVLRERREYHKSTGYKYLQEIEQSDDNEIHENEYFGTFVALDNVRKKSISNNFILHF